MSASNPWHRSSHEYIQIYSKGQFNREKGISTITKEEFMEFTNSIWTMLPESSKKIKHPAPFPEELPYRLIQLYSYKGDTVYDPFMGSGTVGAVCSKTNRKFIGSEISTKYYDIAKARIAKARTE